MGILTEQLQRKSSPTEVPSAEVVSALQDSLAELRPLEKTLFQNGQLAGGILIGHIKILLRKLKGGLPTTRTDFLSLLSAASRLPREQG